MKTKVIAVAVLFMALAYAAFSEGADGVISAGEYQHSASLDKGNFLLYWSVAGDSLHMAMDVKTTGWVAVGFNPTSIMANADMILGTHDASGKLVAYDEWSSGTFGPHRSDTALGGKYDIVSYGGSKNNGRFVFEFVRLLKTGDRYDKDIPPQGTLKLIWAYASGQSITGKHQKAGTVTIDMGGTK